MQSLERKQMLEREQAAVDDLNEILGIKADPNPDFKAFADELIQIAFEGGDVDGAEIQEIALRHNLLKEKNVTEACCDECLCAEVGNIPGVCYFRNYD